MKRLALIFAAVLLMGPIAVAQQKSTEHTLKLGEGGRSEPASIEDVSWLVGNWKGEGFGGIVEESWSPVLGGTMMGMFRLVNDDKVNFYELMVLEESEGSLVLRVKHFSSEFEAWEEKEESLSFRLVRLGDKQAFFSNLTIQRVDEETLHTYLVMRSKDEKVSEKLLRFTKY